MLSNKKLVYVSAAALIFFGIFIFFQNQNRKAEIILAGKIFLVEIADNDLSRSKGLSGHEPLQDNEGMIFIFNTPALEGFWMKDMKFPIDIIWIDENLKISHIEKSLTPETYPTVFYPKTPSLYVLEVSAGQSEKLGLKVGDPAEFNRK
jgi:uncharacterized protein